MEFESPNHSSRSPVQASNNHGTPLCLRRPLSLKFAQSAKHLVLTFLSPEASSTGWRRSDIGVSRISENLNRGIVKTNFNDVEESISVDEGFSLGQSFFPCSRDISDKRGRLKRRGCENNDFFSGGEGMKTLLHFSGMSNHKRRRIGDSFGVSERLHYSYKMIDHWQDQMNRVLAENWEYKRKYWIPQCHGILWSVLQDLTLLEKPCSGIIPRILHSITMLSQADKHWYHVLISSARIYEIKSPDFSELTYDPQRNRGLDEEFEFQIKFQFGYDVEELAWYIHNAIGCLLMNEFCNLVAEFVGHSKFTCDVQIYFKKLVTPWWEQDGIAKIKHSINGKVIDMIEFSPQEEVYFVQEWPTNNLLVDEYSYLNSEEVHPTEPNDDTHISMEKKFISAICCQIVHLCICKTPSPLSCAARNVLKQISMVFKGWFIGVMLGEGLGLTPSNVKFE